MLFPCSRTCLRYGIAVVAVAAAMLLRWALIPVLGLTTPYLTVYPVVVFVSVLFGIGPGIVAGLLGAAAVEAWIAPPPANIPAIGAAVARMGVVLISATYLGHVGQRLRAAESRARADADAARDAQAALRQSEERFRSLADSTPVVLWMTDPVGCIEFVNRAYRDFFAVSLEQVVRPGGWHSLVHPDDIELSTRRLTDALQRRAPYHGRVRARRADGTWRWLETYAAPRFAADGEFLGIAGSSPDVTDRKLAEEALRESEAKFHMLADNISQLAWMADEHGSLFWYNQRWYDYTGAEPARMLGDGWRAVHHPDHVGRVVEKLDRCFRSGEVWEDTFPLRGRDGGYRWFLSRAVPMRDAAGNVTRCFGTNTDITDMLRRQEEIQRLNRTLQALSRSSHAMSRAKEEAEYLPEVCRIIVEHCGHTMVWVGYAEHDPDKRVRPVAWSGFEDGYLHRLDVTWSDTERGRGPIGMAIRTGRPSICTDITTDPRLEPWRDEAVRRGYSSLIALPLVHDAQAFGVLVIYSREPDPFSESEVRLLEELAGDLAHGVHAIRLRKAKERAEAELRHAKEAAESANNAKDHFLAVLSHELRTPLNPALLAAASVEGSPGLPPDLREDVRVIRRNIELSARLIDDMLDLTRIARGKIALDRRLVNGCEVLKHAVETCRADADAKGLALVVDLPPDPVYVHADPARLQQVFWNLLKNAVKFTPDHGRITVTAAATTDCGLQIRVADTGKGIEREALGRVFDAFEQGGQNVTKRYGGLGLGLAICRSLVAMHNGSIRADSDGPGKGATFTVNLPAPPVQPSPGGVSRPSAAIATTAPPRQSDAPRGTILLVEDDHTTAVLTARLLQSLGYRVSTADCMKRALEKSEHERFDVLISDLGLPDGTGEELLRELLQKRPVKAIALSGYGMDGDLKQSARAGFVEHLVKPVSLAQLEAAIDRALANVILPLAETAQPPPATHE